MSFDIANQVTGRPVVQSEFNIKNNDNDLADRVMSAVQGFFKFIGEFFSFLTTSSNKAEKAKRNAEFDNIVKNSHDLRDGKFEINPIIKSSVKQEELFDDFGRSLRIAFVHENVNIDLSKATDAEIKQVYDGFKKAVDKVAADGESARDVAANKRIDQQEKKLAEQEKKQAEELAEKKKAESLAAAELKDKESLKEAAAIFREFNEKITGQSFS